jgi:thioredoxin-like negative regulator of GroEL
MMAEFPSAAKEAELRLPAVADTAGLGRAINDAARPALVLFDAIWCSPARRIEERLLRLFRGDEVAMVRVDVDHAPELARKFAVHAVPTLALFRAGQLAARRLGDIDDGDLQHWLERECMAPCA